MKHLGYAHLPTSFKHFGCEVNRKTRNLSAKGLVLANDRAGAKSVSSTLCDYGSVPESASLPSKRSVSFVQPVVPSFILTCTHHSTRPSLSNFALQLRLQPAPATPLPSKSST